MAMPLLGMVVSLVMVAMGLRGFILMARGTAGVLSGVSMFMLGLVICRCQGVLMARMAVILRLEQANPSGNRQPEQQGHR